MCVALCLSTVVALVLSPVLCAYLLKKPDPDKRRILLAPFNWTLDLSRRGYLRFVGFFVRRAFFTILFFVAACAGTWYVSGRITSGFLPKEDRGWITANLRLSEGQSIDNTIKVVDEIHERTLKVPGIYAVSSNCGSSGMWGTGENLATIWFRLDHWNDRKDPERAIDKIMDNLKAATKDLYAAEIVFSQPAPIRGLGGSSGVGFNFCTMEGATPFEILNAVDGLMDKLRAHPYVKSAVHGLTASTPQMELKLDRQKAELLGITPKVVFQTLQNQLASFYVNDFNIKGGVYEVKLQNDPDYRMSIADILAVRISTASGESVPISSIGSVEYVGGTRETMSYNKMRAAWCDITQKEGISTSQLMELIESIELPKGYIIEWGPVQLQEKENEGRLLWLLAAAFVFAYLFLVAQYESWTIPVPVMLSVLFALLGALIGLWVTNTPLSIYAQLGCVMLIGLAAKNAILMVEFSKQERENGKNVFDAAISGADLRYRAVMMTAWSFVIGVLPLVFASGAGSGAMRAIGICTFSGMLFASVVGIIFVPALYSLFQRLRELIGGSGKGA
jgi:multidrug efflux pump subunit AcrB